MQKITDRITNGSASPEDVETLKSVADNIEGKNHLRLWRGCLVAGAKFHCKVPTMNW